MRLILSADQALAALVLAICLGIGWTLGCWLATRILALLK